jgi:ssDNA-binding Zn-finger/Zn-ribbon topoisomerase 1
VPAIEKECPECGKPLLVRQGKRGSFLGCSGYPKCRHTEPLPDDLAAAATAPAAGSDAPAGPVEPAIEKKCPNCGKTLVVKQSRRGPFLACPGYPDCKHAESLSGVPSQKSASKKVGRKCPDCGKELVLRSGRRGAFIGCSGYPKCRFTEDAGE